MYASNNAQRRVFIHCTFLLFIIIKWVLNIGLTFDNTIKIPSKPNLEGGGV